MLVYNKNGISIDSILFPKKNKTHTEKYTIYIGFYARSKGISIGLYEMSTGINVMMNAWGNGEMKGKNNNARLINESLTSYLSKAKEMCGEIKLKNFTTANQVLTEIKSNARVEIVGKIARGQKEQILAKQKQYEIFNVLESYLANTDMCKERKIKYHVPFQHLKNYFKQDLPPINQITGKDLEGYKKHLNKLNLMPNTISSYCIMIIAIFNHALKLKLITESPIPKRFGGGFEAAKREIITEEEIAKIELIDNSSLKPHLLIAKYILLFQAYTSLGVKELKSLEPTHFKSMLNRYSEQANYIQKERTKTGVEYLIILSPEANRVKDKLVSLVGMPFVLYSDTLINKYYKILAKIAGITKNVAPYQFRHSYGTNYMIRSGRMEDLQKILGHKHIKTTSIYGRITAQRLIDANERMDNETKVIDIKTNLKIAQ